MPLPLLLVCFFLPASASRVGWWIRCSSSSAAARAIIHLPDFTVPLPLVVNRDCTAMHAIPLIVIFACSSRRIGKAPHFADGVQIRGFIEKEEGRLRPCAKVSQGCVGALTQQVLHRTLNNWIDWEDSAAKNLYPLWHAGLDSISTSFKILAAQMLRFLTLLAVPAAPSHKFIRGRCLRLGLLVLPPGFTAAVTELSTPHANRFLASTLSAARRLTLEVTCISASQSSSADGHRRDGEDVCGEIAALLRFFDVDQAMAHFDPGRRDGEQNGKMWGRRRSVLNNNN
ncbi:hypothetical protein B0H14DRAFT_3428812 [Mycena olivaceomarginata]|nr:hypothetical protein B0H14DRAFT_3428812 [Mycena olivaceomarginata]